LHYWQMKHVHEILWLPFLISIHEFYKHKYFYDQIKKSFTE
jgi:hypothetical protein